MKNLKKSNGHGLNSGFVRLYGGTQKRVAGHVQDFFTPDRGSGRNHGRRSDRRWGRGVNGSVFR